MSICQLGNLVLGAVVAASLACASGAPVPESWKTHEIAAPPSEDWDFHPGGYSYEITLPGTAVPGAPVPYHDTFHFLGRDKEPVIFTVQGIFYDPYVWEEKLTVWKHLGFLNEGHELDLVGFKVLATRRLGAGEVRQESIYRYRESGEATFQRIEAVRKEGDWIFVLDATVQEPWMKMHRQTIETVLDSFSVEVPEGDPRGGPVGDPL